MSGFDLTHVLSASATAPLPFGKGRRFANSGGLLNYIIGNWQLNGILTLTSGLPYYVYISSDIPNIGNFAPLSPEMATFGRIWLEILTCQIRA